MAYDIGGQDSLRQIWSTFYVNTNGIIFVIDSSDRDNIQKVRKEIENIIHNESLRYGAFLFIANKQDIENCMTTKELINELQLDQIIGVSWSLFGTSIKNGEGIDKAINWLIKSLQQQIS